MCISLVLGLLAGIPIVDVTLEDGTTKAGIATVIGQGFNVVNLS
jgi:GntP family gluconate:H+ symporter